MEYLAQIFNFTCTGYIDVAGEPMCTITDLFQLIRQVANFLMVTVAPAALIIFIAIGAYKIIFSSGDPKKIGEGRKTIFWAIIGFVVAVGAWAIINTLFELLGITPPCPWYQLQC